VYLDAARCRAPAGLVPGAVAVLRRVELRRAAASGTFYAAVAPCSHVVLERLAPPRWPAAAAAAGAGGGAGGAGAERPDPAAPATLIGTLDPYRPAPTFRLRP
jgi:hypothetical protein